MLRVLWMASVVGSVLFTFSPAGAAENSTMSPGQALARINSSGQLELCSKVSKPVYVEKLSVYTVQVPITEQRTLTKRVTVDGVAKDVVETYEVTVYKPETRTTTTKVMQLVSETTIQNFPPGTNGFRREADKADIPLYDLAGNRLSVTTVEDRLQNWTVVLISSSGKALDRQFASIFKPTTLVIGVPARTPMAMPAPVIPAQPYAPAPQAMPVPQPAVAPPSASRAPGPALTPVAFLANDASPILPAALAPTYAFAKVWGEKTLALRTEEERTHQLPCLITKQVERMQDGKKVTVTVCEPTQIEKVVQTQETLKYPLEEISVTQTPNKDVTNTELPSILAYEKLAVVSADGKPIDPLWLRNVRDGVLVIVAPAVPPTPSGGDQMTAPGAPSFGPPSAFPADAPPPVPQQAAPPARPVEVPVRPAP